MTDLAGRRVAGPQGSWEAEPATVPIPRVVRRQTPWMLVGLGAVLLVVVAFAVGWATGGFAGNTDPCAASPGSHLTGFDGVTGPADIPVTEQARTQGAASCRYATEGVAASRPGEVFSGVIMLRYPRDVVDADPKLSKVWRAGLSARLSSSGPDYPIDLVRSQVGAVVSPSTSGGGDAVSVICATDADYWNIVVSSSGRDDSVGLDSLLVDMGCEPVRP